MAEGVPIRKRNPRLPQDLEIPQRGMESPSEQIKLLEGFPQTSSFIAKDPAKTTVIFRRFDQLAVRNLLHLEARLTALEELQNAYDRDDVDFNNNNEPIATAARSWEDFAVFGTSRSREDSTVPPRTSGHDSHRNLPESVLVRWRTQRAVNVEDYKEQASLRNTPIVGKWMTIKEVTEASFCEERDAGSIISGLEQKAAAEANAFYDNPLGCGPCSLALIHSRWELATAIETSLKEYRAYESVPLGLTELK